MLQCLDNKADRDIGAYWERLSNGHCIYMEAKVTEIIANIMTSEEASRCVAKIKAGMDDVRLLVLNLYERQGWIALNYKNWRECVTGEFVGCQQRLYQLLDAAKVDRAISTIVETHIPESQARELAPLMRQDETEMVDTWHELQAQYGDKVTAAKIKDVVQRKLKQEVARTHVPEPAITPAIPIGKYRCVVIDPPWPMVKIERAERPNQGVTLDYPVMTLEEIADAISKGHMLGNRSYRRLLK